MSRSDHRGFRRFLPLLLLAAALALAAAFVLLLPAIEKRFPPKNGTALTKELTYQTIAERDPKTLRTVTVSHQNGDTYTLYARGGTLELEDAAGQAEPIDAAAASAILQYTTAISVEDTVTTDVSEVLGNLPDMGLMPPEITVTATYSDGGVETISIGNNLPETSYYYYRWSGDDGVYLCNSGAYDAFAGTADMLRSVTQPPIAASLIERIGIRRQDAEPIVCSFSSGGGNEIYGTLQSPYVYPMDPQAANALLSAAENFRLGTRLQPVTDENRALYGLNSPLATVEIAQREGAYTATDSQGAVKLYPLAASTITLTIGAADGDFFYFCEYEGTCYRVSGVLLTAFLHAEAANYAAACPADMGSETVRGVSVQTGNGPLDFLAAYTENVLPNNELETDEKGNVVYTETATLNGEAIPAEAFNALVTRLGQMTAADPLIAPETQDGAPLWQLTITTAHDRTRTLAAYTLDAFSDVLAVDGVALYSVSSEALEIALGEFASLPSPAATPAN